MEVSGIRGNGRGGSGMLDLLTVGAAASDGAAPAFDAILRHIAGARESIEIHMYVWRSDAIGNAMGEALLRAADRGVRVRILKDTGAILYERAEMNRKSYLKREVSRGQRFLCRLAIRALPDTLVRDGHREAAGEALATHPGVTIGWVSHTHTKYFLFDRRILITGSINVEDRHRGYFDYMMEVGDPRVIADFLATRDGGGSGIEERAVEVVANTRCGRARDFRIAPCVLSLIAGARASIRVEMAYLGDPEVTAALAGAAKRGVEVVVLFSRAANIGNDLNYRTVRQLIREAPVVLYRTPKMIHSKLLLVDGDTVLVGSANLSVFSLRKAEELDLLIRRRPELVAAFLAEFESRRAVSERIVDEKCLTSYGALAAALQQWSQRVIAG